MSTRLFGRISSSIALVAESAREACHLNARALRWGQPLARGRRPRRPLPLLHRHAVKRGPRTPAFRFLFGKRGPDVDFCYAIPKRRSVRFKAEQVLLKAVPCAQSSAATRSTASNAASHSPERHASSLANNHGYTTDEPLAEIEGPGSESAADSSKGRHIAGWYDLIYDQDNPQVPAHEPICLADNYSSEDSQQGFSAVIAVFH